MDVPKEKPKRLMDKQSVYLINPHHRTDDPSQAGIVVLRAAPERVAYYITGDDVGTLRHLQDVAAPTVEYSSLTLPQPDGREVVTVRYDTMPLLTELVAYQNVEMQPVDAPEKAESIFRLALNKGCCGVDKAILPELRQLQAEVAARKKNTPSVP